MTKKEYRKELTAFMDANEIGYETSDNTRYLFTLCKKAIKDTDKTFLYSNYNSLSAIEFDEPEQIIKIEKNGNNEENQESNIEENVRGETETSGSGEPETEENLGATGETSDADSREQKTKEQEIKKPKKDYTLWYAVGALILLIGFIYLKNTDNVKS